MGRRIDAEHDDVLHFVGEHWIARKLERLEPVRPALVGTSGAEGRALTEMPTAAAMAPPVQCVASCGGSVLAKARPRSITVWSSAAMRGCRVLFRTRPPTPAAMHHSCQRQTQVLELPVSRMIALVPRRAADRSTICIGQRYRDTRAQGRNSHSPDRGGMSNGTQSSVLNHWPSFHASLSWRSDLWTRDSALSPRALCWS